MDPVANHAASRPDHPAIITAGSVTTYRVFDESASKVRKALLRESARAASSPEAG